MTDADDPLDPIALLDRLPRRLRALVPGLLALALVCGALCAMVVSKTWVLSLDVVRLWLVMLAGSYSLAEHFGQRGPWPAIWIGHLALFAAHPLYPRPLTAAITLVAIASWGLFGVGAAFVDV